MTVKELKEYLTQYKDEYIVILQSDSEGNSYSPLSGICSGIYIPETEYYGEINDEYIKNGDNCIILYPIY